MNLKNIRKYKADVVKYYWCFESRKSVNKPARFKKIKSTMGPEIFSLVITKTITCSNEKKSLLTIITNNSLQIYFRYDLENIIKFGKEYNNDDYFNALMLNPDLPTPEELKEIRKYYKKHHKNHQIFITID